MKKFFLLIVVVLVAISAIGIGPSFDTKSSSNTYAVDNLECMPNQLIIGFSSDDVLNQYSSVIREKYDLKLLEKSYKGSFEVVEFPSDKKMTDMIELIKNEGGVYYVEPNQITKASYVPNDPYFYTYQWNFYTKGRLYRGTASGNVQSPSNYGIQAEAAWDLFKPTNTAVGAKYPGEDISVAILDTGIAYANYITIGGITGSSTTYKKAPDLEGTIFDSANAKNFTVYPATQLAFDDQSHGTHVCGTIAQATNTTTPMGCAGIAYKAKIMPVKVLNRNGSGTNAGVANGIYWAADRGAKIINMSLGSSYGDTTLYSAIKYAYNKGVLIVCASGNNGGAISYPAAYSTECIAVGATNFNGARASFSNFGTQLDIVAPGQYITQQTLASSYNLSTFSYLTWQGTSMAAPHVAGVAALVWSRNPNFTRDQVKSALLNTARDLGSTGFDNYYGYGLVDALAAVKWTP